MSGGKRNPAVNPGGSHCPTHYGFSSVSSTFCAQSTTGNLPYFANPLGLFSGPIGLYFHSVWVSQGFGHERSVGEVNKFTMTFGRTGSLV